MATLEQIVAYVRQYAAKYPLAALRAQLLKQGVPQALADQAIQIVSGAQKPPAPAAAQPPASQPPATRPPVPAAQPPAARPPVPGTQPPATRPPIQGPATAPPRPVPGPIGKPGTAGQDVLHTPAVQPPPSTTPPPPAQPPAAAPPPAAQPPAQPPAPHPAALPPGYIPPKGPPVPPPPGRSFILVVDDDQLIRDMLVSKLEGAGYRVTCAEDAAQSVIQAEGMRLALIISDIEMPGFGTGVDALKKLRASSAIKRNLPVIFVTGMPPQEARKIVPNTDPYVRLMHKPVDWNLMRLYIRDMTGMDKVL